MTRNSSLQTERGVQNEIAVAAGTICRALYMPSWSSLSTGVHQAGVTQTPGRPPPAPPPPKLAFSAPQEEAGEGGRAALALGLCPRQRARAVARKQQAAGRQGGQ